jgi:hypothetical protein
MPDVHSLRLVKLRCINAQMLLPEIEIERSGYEQLVWTLKFAVGPHKNDTLSMSIRPINPIDLENKRPAQRIDIVMDKAFKFFGVKKNMNEVNGRPVRLLIQQGEHYEFKFNESGVWAVGDYLENRWFSPGSSARYLPDASGAGIPSWSGEGQFCRTELGVIWERDDRGGIPSVLSESGRLFHITCDNPDYFNVQFEPATLVPEGDKLSVLLKFRDVARYWHKDLIIKFTPKPEQLSELCQKLQAVAGVSKFERIGGRMARVIPPTKFDEAERAKLDQALDVCHWRVAHPVLGEVIDITDYGGAVRDPRRENE